MLHTLYYIPYILHHILNTHTEYTIYNIRTLLFRWPVGSQKGSYPEPVQAQPQAALPRAGRRRHSQGPPGWSTQSPERIPKMDPP